MAVTADFVTCPCLREYSGAAIISDGDSCPVGSVVTFKDQIVCFNKYYHSHSNCSVMNKWLSSDTWCTLFRGYKNKLSAVFFSFVILYKGFIHEPKGIHNFMYMSFSKDELFLPSLQESQHSNVLVKIIVHLEEHLY